MPRTQLNIDCSSEELRSWKRSALDEGKALGVWVRERLGGDDGVTQKSVVSPKPNPSLQGKSLKALSLLSSDKSEPVSELSKVFAKVKTATHY